MSKKLSQVLLLAVWSLVIAETGNAVEITEEICKNSRQYCITTKSGPCSEFSKIDFGQFGESCYKAFMKDWDHRMVSTQFCEEPYKECLKNVK